MSHIAVIGCGLVGRGWAIVFARAGRSVLLFDSVPGAAEAAIAAIEHNIADLTTAGLIDDPTAVLSRMRVAGGLAEALMGAEYAQESVFEEVETKRRVFREIDACIGPETLVGSSSSGIPASAFTQDVACRSRILVAHPVNPPHLVPVVELVPAPWTDPQTVKTVRGLMESVGQAPVELAREIEGFIINRLQGVLLMEAWRLVEDGCASVADIDRTVALGLGLRWSFMGPFETIDLNAPEGVRDYVTRYKGIYERLAPSQMRMVEWHGPVLNEIERDRRKRLSAGDLPKRQVWRDRRLMALAQHKRRAAKDIGE